MAVTHERVRTGSGYNINADDEVSMKRHERVDKSSNTTERKITSHAMIMINQSELLKYVLSVIENCNVSVLS